MHDAARRRAEKLAASPDPTDREVGARLLGQRPAHGPGHSVRAGHQDLEPAHRPSRWQHVDLADLLASFGNQVQVAADRLKSGHEPLHHSRSGTCLIAWLAAGRWWCSSCHRSGDAAGYVMTALGITYAEAAAWLTDRYGPSPDGMARPASIRHRSFTAALP
jgi:hypothetical protein